MAAGREREPEALRARGSGAGARRGAGAGRPAPAGGKRGAAGAPQPRAAAAAQPPAAPAWGRSFAFAAAGLRRAWRTERNFRVQCAAGWAALGAGVLAGLPGRSLGLLALLGGAVLGMEAMNSAIEAVVDLVSPHRHPLAAAAKDLAAGAVLAVSLGALAGGAALFWPLPALPDALLAGARRAPAGAALWLAALIVLAALAWARPAGRDVS